MKRIVYLFAVCLLLRWVAAAPAADWVTYAGHDGAGHGKRVVLLTGDEEYRSEESLPMLAKILAVRHGFDCTVLFAIYPATGFIDPVTLTNIPGMEFLDHADLCIMALRYRELPDSQMRHFVEYVRRGGPVIALRTSTHAFRYQLHTNSPFAKFDCNSTAWPGGFGQQVLGETWVSHHGQHGKESTRAVINPSEKDSPLLRSITDIWCPTDVYTVTHLPGDASVLLFGHVLSGMHPTDSPVTGSKNDPMMPVAWTRYYTNETGKISRIFTTTMGAAVDLQNEDLRRLLVNASFWAVGLADRIPAKADVRYVGEYHPTWFGFGQYKKGVKPDDLKSAN